MIWNELAGGQRWVIGTHQSLGFGKNNSRSSIHDRTIAGRRL